MLELLVAAFVFEEKFNRVTLEVTYSKLLLILRYNEDVIKIINNPISEAEIKELATEIGGFYIKIVVDIKKEVMAAGAKMHVDEERLLLEQGSRKIDVWGGGYDLEIKQITYDSIINNKPGVNASSDILDPEIREKFETIVRKLLGL